MPCIPCLLLLCSLVNPALVADKPKIETFQGRVVPLADVLKKQGIELDPDVAKQWLALQTDGGKAYVLVKDAGARMFFRDPRLLNRPMRLQGRFVGDSSLLQVLRVHSLKDGKPHEVFYWCDICTIKRHFLDEKGICDCCGGPMELREVAVDQK